MCCTCVSCFSTLSFCDIQVMLMPGQDVREDLEPAQVTDLDSGFSGSSGNSASYGGSSYVTPRGRPPMKASTPAPPPPSTPSVPVLDEERVDYRAAGRCRDVCCAAPQYQAPSSPIGKILIINLDGFN